MPDQPVHAPYGALPDGGTVRPITRWGEPVMHRPTRPVTSYDEELRPGDTVVQYSPYGLPPVIVDLRHAVCPADSHRTSEGA